MKELDRAIVTVTRINYGFDETEFKEEGVNEYSIKGERTIVEMDGEVYYDQYIASHLMIKRHLGSPIDCFWDYIVQLFPANKPQCGGNSGSNGSLDVLSEIANTSAGGGQSGKRVPPSQNVCNIRLQRMKYTEKQAMDFKLGKPRSKWELIKALQEEFDKFPDDTVFTSFSAVGIGVGGSSYL